VTEYASGLSQPVSLAFNQTGELFIANQGNNQISKVSPSGGTTTTVAQLQQTPQALAVNAAGELVVGMASGSLLNVKADGTMSTLGSGFSSASGLAIDQQGTLYVADATQNTVFKASALPTSPATKEAQASLHCYSLRFQFRFLRWPA